LAQAIAGTDQEQHGLANEQTLKRKTKADQKENEIKTAAKRKSMEIESIALKRRTRGTHTGVRTRTRTGEFLRRTDVTPTCVSGTTFSP